MLLDSFLMVSRVFWVDPSHWYVVVRVSLCRVLLDGC